MQPFLTSLGAWLKRSQSIIFIIVIGIVTIGSLSLVVHSVDEMQSIFFVFAKVLIAVVAYQIIDKYIIMPDVDTEYQLKKGNVAYAIHQAGLLIALAIMVGSL